MSSDAVLTVAVEDVLAALASGLGPPCGEHARVVLAEEACRRNVHGLLLAGHPQNIGAAEHLAGETASLANTPGDGAIIVGVETTTGSLLGSTGSLS